jgi:ligand-binding sensor domain-containing protein
VAALGTGGLHLHVQGEWTELPIAGARPPLATGAASGSALAVWGRSGAWIWRVGGTQPEPIVLGVGRATCMTWGEDGELWIGAERGLMCWNGDRVRPFVWNRERRDRITALLAHAGTLYVGSDAGVWSAPARTLRDAPAPAGAALEALGRRLGLLDGLPDAHVTSAVVHDSRVWIGTLAGLVMLE